MLQTFGCVRKVYNETISINQGLYSAGMATFSKIDMNNYCNRVMKNDDTYLRDVDKYALTNAIFNAMSAYKNFFEKRTSYPKFKSRKNTYQSYTTNIVSVENKHIKLPKLGRIRAVISRHPKEGWVAKSATVSMDAGGRIFASVLFQLPEQEITPAPNPTKETTVGLDYSSPHFYIDSNGNKAGAIPWYRKAEKRLVIEQRKLSHCKHGSNRYNKQKAKVNRLYYKTANQRLDFCHKESRKIANSYDAVCVEDVNLQNMAQTLNFGKAVGDNGFGMFRNFLKYKLEEQGKYYIVIDKWFPSSKTCRHCGNINHELQLGQMEWICPNCGEKINRDVNAAINIRDEGLRMFYAA